MVSITAPRLSTTRAQNLENLKYGYASGPQKHNNTSTFMPPKIHLLWTFTDALTSQRSNTRCKLSMSISDLRTSPLSLSLLFVQIRLWHHNHSQPASTWQSYRGSSLSQQNPSLLGLGRVCFYVGTKEKMLRIYLLSALCSNYN